MRSPRWNPYQAASMAYPRECAKARIDEFQQGIIWPAAHRSMLPKQFFQTRITKNSQGHIKAFAAECIAAVGAVHLFCEMVLQPAQQLVEHCRCLKLLKQVFDMLLLDECAVRNVNVLKQTLVEHHKLFIEIYGLDFVGDKVKPHLMLHLPRCIQRFGMVASCFAMERKHKLGKAIARNTQGAGYELHMLRRSISNLLYEIEWAPLSPTFLPKPVNAPLLRAATAAIVPDIGPAVQAAVQMNTKCGRILQGRLVLLAASADEPAMVAMTQFFVSTSTLSSPLRRYFLCCERYVRIRNTDWAQTGELVFCEARHVMQMLPYVQARGNAVRPVLLVVPGVLL